MAAEDEIRRASEQFYEALNRVTNGDPQQMMDIWSHWNYPEEADNF